MQDSDYYRDLLKRFMLSIAIEKDLIKGVTQENKELIPCRFKIKPRESEELDNLYKEISSEWNAFAKAHNTKFSNPEGPSE